MEDLSLNLKESLSENPWLQVPSPDSIQKRMKELATCSALFDTPKGNKQHEFSFNS